MEFYFSGLSFRSLIFSFNKVLVFEFVLLLLIWVGYFTLSLQFCLVLLQQLFLFVLYFSSQLFLVNKGYCLSIFSLYEYFSW